MMSFEPLWETMKKKNVTTYKLIKDYNISRGMLDKLKHDRNVTLETVERFCEILDCRVEDIVVYRKDLWHSFTTFITGGLIEETVVLYLLI